MTDPEAGRRLAAAARVRRTARMVAVVDIDVVDAENRLVAVGRGRRGGRPG